MMSAKHQQMQKSSFVQRMYRFLGGAALGAFVTLLPPISYASSIHWHFPQVALVLGAMLSCGFLAMAFGKGFIDAVMKSFESWGF